MGIVFDIVDESLSLVSKTVKAVVGLIVIGLFFSMISAAFCTPKEKTEELALAKTYREQYREQALDIIASHGLLDGRMIYDDTQYGSDHSEYGSRYNIDTQARTENSVDYEDVFLMLQELKGAFPQDSPDDFRLGILTLSLPNGKSLWLGIEHTGLMYIMGPDITFDYTSDGTYLPDKPFTNMREDELTQSELGFPDYIFEGANMQVWSGAEDSTAYVWRLQAYYVYVVYVRDGYVYNYRYMTLPVELR